LAGAIRRAAEGVEAGLGVVELVGVRISWFWVRLLLLVVVIVRRVWVRMRRVVKRVSRVLMEARS
jgi:hypothetical protein